jgi:nitroreductase
MLEERRMVVRFYRRSKADRKSIERRVIVMNETLKVLRERRSIRAYRPEQIKPEELDAVIESGLYAPSAMGRQSVTMVAVQDAETIRELSRLNAEIMGQPDSDPFYGAPTLIVVLADPAATTPHNAERDGALAMGNLMNAAWSMGIGSCWVNRAEETFARPEGKALLKKWGLPETLTGVGNCVLGYPAQTMEAKPRRTGRVVRV